MLFDTGVAALRSCLELPTDDAYEFQGKPAPSAEQSNGSNDGVFIREMGEAVACAVLCENLGLIIAGPIGAVIGGALAIGWDLVHTHPEKGPMWFYE